jgi:hypothetical protein
VAAAVAVVAGGVRVATKANGVRFPPAKKDSTPVDRREELRKARASAPSLRTAWPDAALVRVELEFQANPLLAHAPQAYSLYPAAKAHFGYACPFGDCDGVYDLNAVVFETLQAGKRNARGTLTCSGHRSRSGKDEDVCALSLRYSITVRLGDAVAPG